MLIQLKVTQNEKKKKIKLRERERDRETERQRQRQRALTKLSKRCSYRHFPKYNYKYPP